MKKLINFLAVVVWILLASYRLRVSWEANSILSLLLAIQSGLIAYYIAIRRDSSKEPPFYQQIFSWFAVFAPILIRVKSDCIPVFTLIPFLGVGITIWALSYLGKSFGIAPADRGLVKSGPYKYVRHPMYAGELLSIMAGSVGCFSYSNIFVLLIMLSTFYIRISWEEKLIKGYSLYSKYVPWRLVPGVW